MRKFLLVSFLMFGTQTIPAIYGSPSLGGEAYAADFTGKIKRIRIKPRRSGSGFKIRVASEVDGGDVATSATLMLTDPATDAVLFEGEQSITRNAKARYSAAISGTVAENLARGLILELTVSAADGETTTFEGVDITAVDGSSEWAEGADKGGLKFRARISDGGVKIVVLNEDGSWLPASRDGIKLRWLNSDRREIGAQGIAAPDDVVQSYVFEVSADQLSSDEVAVSSAVTVGRVQLIDGELTSEELGTVTASTLSQVPGGEASTDLIERVSLKQTQRGDNKLVVYTSATDGSIGAIEAQIAVDDTDEYILDVFDESPVRRTRVFAEPGIAFSSGVEKVLGYTYKMGVDLRNGDGKAVRETIWMEVKFQDVDAFSDLSVGDVVSTFEFAGGLGEGVFLYEEGGTLGVLLEWNGEDIHEVVSVGVTITAPEDASVPVNDTEVADLAYEVDKWVMKAEGSIGEGSLAAVNVTLVDDKGNVLDTVGVSGVAGNAGSLSNDKNGYLNKDYLDVLSEQATDDEDNDFED